MSKLWSRFSSKRRPDKYSVPQAELSQPRNLIGRHILSAVIGITVYKYIPLETSILSALAVSLSIVVMHFTRTIHPPGGATALIAVIGSSQIHDLGYMFIIRPITTGALILLIIALIVNNISKNPNRHYCPRRSIRTPSRFLFGQFASSQSLDKNYITSVR
ncbi:MAG: hypothetical protein B7Y13_09180, partial [Sulfurovum sp. 24-42-9]